MRLPRVRDRAAYDAVLSVEMIEAVGHEYWPTYFGTIDRLLAPGGRVGIQAITMPHDRMLATRAPTPGSTSTSSPAASCPRSRRSSRSPASTPRCGSTGRLSLGDHYAETLRQWDQVPRRAGRVLDLGFDETFVRMWHFYLEYSRAGFASGYLDVDRRGDAAALLDVRPGQHVLDVGAGSGWTTALLARLVGPDGVADVELVPDLAAWGAANLAATDQPWASLVEALPGVLGLPDHAPYDRILVSAEPARMPEELVTQLATDGGAMVIPVARG